MSVKDLIKEELVFPPGLTYEEDCITPESEAKIVKYIDEQPWNTTLSRRTQHYGYEYDYKNTSVLKPASPVAGPLLSVAKHFIENETQITIFCLPV